MPEHPTISERQLEELVGLRADFRNLENKLDEYMHGDGSDPGQKIRIDRLEQRAAFNSKLGWFAMGIAGSTLAGFLIWVVTHLKP